MEDTLWRKKAWVIISDSLTAFALTLLAIAVYVIWICAIAFTKSVAIWFISTIVIASIWMIFQTRNIMHTVSVFNKVNFVIAIAPLYKVTHRCAWLLGSVMVILALVLLIELFRGVAYSTPVAFMCVFFLFNSNMLLLIQILQLRILSRETVEK